MLLVGLFCLLCTESIFASKILVELDVPQNLIKYILDTKLWLCGDPSRILFVNCQNASSRHNLRTKIMAGVTDSRVVLQDSSLVENIPDVKCVILFADDLNVNWDNTHFPTKTIVIAEVENSTIEMPSVLAMKKRDEFFRTACFAYNGSAYQSGYFYAAELVSINFTLDNETGVIQGLFGDLVRFWYTPHAELFLVMHYFWDTIHRRHNLMTLVPLEMPEVYNARQMVTDVVSMHRVVYAECFIVPIIARRPLEYVLIDPFDVPTWLCIVITATTVVILLGTFRSKPWDVPLLVLEMIRTMLSDPHRTPSSVFERVTITSFVIGNMILMAAYESLITASISDPSFYPQLDTLDQINSSCWVSSDLSYASRMQFNFMYTEEPSRKGKILVLPCYHTSCYNFRLGNYMCNIMRHINAPCQKYRPSLAKSISHPVLGAIIPHSKSMDRLVRFYAAAFVEGDLYHLIEEKEEKNYRDMNEPELLAFELKPLTWGDLIVVWKILTRGYALSILVFALEKVYRRWMRFSTKVLSILKRLPK